MNTSAALSGFGKDSRKSIGLNLTTFSVFRLLADHARRSLKALAGFKLFGHDWLRPWISYAFSPLLNRFLSKKTVRFGSFNVRRGECDLYTFANVFEDYPVSEIERALSEVTLIVDLGTNVGAFSCFILAVCRKQRLTRRIIAVEPNRANIDFLRSQPFAHALSIRHAAVGPTTGTATLVRGHNSVSDYVDFSGRTDGDAIDVLSLESLCDQPALVKMDIEGAEWGILEGGWPSNVQHLVLEWHPRPGTSATLIPRDLLPGNWTLVSRDLFGASMWYFRARST